MAHPEGRTEPKRETYRYTASSYRYKTYEEELYELVQLSEVPIDKELFKVILELLRLNVAPNAILQVLKSLKSAAESQSPSLSYSQQHSPETSTSQSS